MMLLAYPGRIRAHVREGPGVFVECHADLGVAPIPDFLKLDTAMPAPFSSNGQNLTTLRMVVDEEHVDNLALGP